MRTQDQVKKEIAKLDTEIKEFYQPSGGNHEMKNAAPLLARRRELREELEAMKEEVANG